MAFHNGADVVCERNVCFICFLNSDSSSVSHELVIVQTIRKTFPC